MKQTTAAAVTFLGEVSLQQPEELLHELLRRRSRVKSLFYEKVEGGRGGGHKTRPQKRPEAVTRAVTLGVPGGDPSPEKVTTAAVVVAARTSRE